MQTDHDKAERGEGVQAERVSSTRNSKPGPMDLCAIFSLLFVIAAAASSFSAKDSGFFGQDITLVANIGNLFLGLGSYKFTFGWQGFCYDFTPGVGNPNAAAEECYKYTDSTVKDLQYMDALQTLGIFSIVLQGVSLALAVIFLLQRLLVSFGKVGTPQQSGKVGQLCITVLLMSLIFCVTIVSWPVMTTKFVDNVSPSNWIYCAWSYALILVAMVLWGTNSCFSDGDDAYD